MATVATWSHPAVAAASVAAVMPPAAVLIAPATGVLELEPGQRPERVSAEKLGSSTPDAANLLAIFE